MITTGIFLLLAAFLFVLVLYAFVDNHNRIYGNVFAMFIGIILSFWLSLNLLTGNIGEFVVNTTTEAANVTTYAYKSTPMIDTSLSYFFAFVGVVLVVLTILVIIGVIRENLASGEVEE